MKRRFFLGLAGALLVANVAGAASPRATGMWGARSSALAGSVSADAEDCSASFYNPANLALGSDSSLCIDYSGVFPNLSPAGRSEADQVSHNVGGGIASRGALFGIPFGVGAMLALPGAKLSRFEAIASIDPSWVLETNRPQVSFSAIGFGIQPLARLSLGAALHVLAGVRGGFEVGGALAQPDAYDSELRHSVDADLASSRSFALGASYDVSDALRLALSYRHSARITQSIDGRLAGTIGAADVPADYRAGSEVIPAAYPSLLVLGARYRVRPALGLSAEIAWENFSEWPSPDTRSRSSLTLADIPTNLITTMPPPAAVPDPHDRFVPRLGAEYRALSTATGALFVRGGYAFERSPLPPQTHTRWLDADRHTLSAGIGFERALGADTTLRADAFGAFTLLPERKALESSALGAPAKASGTQASAGGCVSLGF